MSKETMMEAMLHTLTRQFLTDPVPDSFMEWEHEDKINFIASHTWEPLEDVDSEVVLDIIENTYEEMRAYIYKNE